MRRLCEAGQKQIPHAVQNADGFPPCLRACGSGGWTPVDSTGLPERRVGHPLALELFLTIDIRAQTENTTPFVSE
jgi:hypothetical protein